MKWGGDRYDRVIRLIVGLCVVTAPFWTWALFFAGEYGFVRALVLVPLFVFASLAGVFYVTAGDPFLRKAMSAALLLKLVAVALFTFASYHVYAGSDSIVYFQKGSAWADNVLIRGDWQVYGSLLQTGFVNHLVGLLIVFFGKSFPALMVLFGLASLWGQYFFYRTFRVAFPRGNHRLAALLLLFFPSIVYWSAAIGKDSLLILFLGSAAYGYVYLSQRADLRGFLLIAFGGVGAWMIRPHVAGMMGISVTVAYLTGRHRSGLMGVVTKSLAVPVLVGGTYYLINEAQAVLNVKDVEQGMRFIGRVSRTNLVGGSAFGGGASTAERILTAPFLLFRPFPWEAHNLPSAVAALEGLFLLGLIWIYRRELWQALTRLRSDSFVLAIVVYAVQYSVIFAVAISNFGILVRQRIMLLPFVLMLLAAEPVVTRRVPARTPVPFFPTSPAPVMRSRPLSPR